MPTPANASNTYKQQIAAIATGDVMVDPYIADAATTADGIIAAVEAAGANGSIRFTPGTTYTIDSSCYARPGQTWIGYGATIKRANEISSALTGDVSSGSNVVIPVTDGSKFSVGMEVAGWEADTTGNFSSITRVTVVNGNNVTIANLSINLATGSSAVLTAVIKQISGTLSNLVYGDASPDNVTLLGLTFDGNRTNNESSTSPLRWELFREVDSLGANSIVDGCKFIESPGEGLYSLGNYGKIINNQFEGINGNGIHLSAGENGVMSNNTFVDINTLEITPLGFQTDGIGHQDGAVSFSNGVAGWTINTFSIDTALRGFGNIGGDAIPVLISGGTIKDCPSGPFEILSDGNGQAEQVLVTGVSIENCGTWGMAGAAMTGSGNINNCLFSDLDINRTLVTINRCKKLSFKNTKIRYGSSPVKIASISTANPMVITTQQPHKVTNSYTVKIWGLTGVSGNDPTGTQTATVTGTTTLTVPVDGAGFAATYTDALIKESNITDTLFDVELTEDSYFDIEAEDGGIGINLNGGDRIKVSGKYVNNYINAVQRDAGTSSDTLDISINASAGADLVGASYRAIYLFGRSQVHDCVLAAEAGTSHIVTANTANAAESTFLNNQMYGTLSGYSLDIGAAVIDCVALGNIFDRASAQINDRTSTGTTITHNNYTIGTDTDITPV